MGGRGPSQGVDQASSESKGLDADPYAAYVDDDEDALAQSAEMKSSTGMAVSVS